MLVDRKKLKDALAIVKPGLAKKESIEQTTSFAFIDGYVVTYNDCVSIQHPLDGIVDIHGAIAAEQMYKLLERLTEEKIEIELKENEILIKCGRVKAGMVLKKEIVLPLKELEGKKVWEELTEDFVNGVEFVARASIRDVERPMLSCVHVSPSGYVETSDGARIARYSLSNYTFQNDYMLVMEDALKVAALAPSYVAWGNGWVHYKTLDGTVISCRLFSGNFPLIDPHIKVNGKLIRFPTTVLDVLNRAQVFAKRDTALNEIVTIKLANNRFIVQSTAEGTGWFEEELNIQYKDDPVQFSITPTLLKDIVSEELECELGRNRLKFTKDKWLYVTLLRV